jgi:hypothetical protein
MGPLNAVGSKKVASPCSQPYRDAMSDTAKRKFWQFNLATLVVVVLVLGGLNSWSQYDSWHRRCYGFPMTVLMIPTADYAQQRRDTLQQKESADWIDVGPAMNFENDRLAPLYYARFSWLRAFGNLSIWLLALYAIASIISRRRLGTAILMTLLAGLFIRQNMILQRHFTTDDGSKIRFLDCDDTGRGAFGWPVQMAISELHPDTLVPNNLTLRTTWDWRGVFINVMVCTGGLVFVAIIIECWMSETYKPERRWFQFHLITAVLMMLLLAIILHFNMSTYQTDYDSYCGWPLRSFVIETDSDDNRGRYYVENYGYVALDYFVLLFAPVFSGFIFECLLRRSDTQDMSEKPKRPWFRFHLSTAVVVMIVAALVIRANCNPFLFKEQVNDLILGTNHQFGWPLPAIETNSFLDRTRFYPLGLTVNVVVGTCIVLASSLSEYLVRRREARKT